MHLSIFSSEAIRDIAAQSKPDRLWHGTLLLTAALTIVACSLLLRLLFSPFPEPSIHRQAWASLDADTEVVFVGASLVRTDINPALLNRRSANITVDAGNYAMFEMILRRNLARMPNLRYAVIQLDPLCLLYDRWQYSDDFTELYDQGVTVTDLPKPRAWQLQQRILTSALLRPIFFLDRVTPTSIFAEREPPDGHRGPGTRASTFRMTPADLAARDLTEDNGLLNSPARNPNHQALLRICDLLDEASVQPIFMHFPQIPAYADARVEEWHRLQHDLVAELQTRYGDDFVLWDLQFPEDILLEDFSDTRHLNTYGAAKLSTHLNQRLNQ